ncbi:MAG: hypothetical protein ACKN9T_00865 [Candidatus Methylumidiphilus sp.]
MSNHGGSYMLNDTLKILDQYSVYEFLGREKTLELVNAILKLSQEHDCNTGEILEDIGERLGICSSCLRPTDEFQDGVCQQCHVEYYTPDS